MKAKEATFLRQPGLLDVYLNDHLAVASGGARLARRLADALRPSPYGAVLQDVADEIEQDRRTLLDAMGRLDVPVDRLKVGTARFAERIGRLKLNGSLFHRSPLSSVVELEALCLAVQDKAMALRVLREVGTRRRALEPHDFDALLDRARRQEQTLAQIREEVSATVFSADRLDASSNGATRQDGTPHRFVGDPASSRRA